MALSIPIITEYVGKGLDKFKTELALAETNSAKAGLVIKKAMIPATAAIGALGAALGDATKAAMEDLASQEKLATQLRTSTPMFSEFVKPSTATNKRGGGLAAIKSVSERGNGIRPTARTP